MLDASRYATIVRASALYDLVVTLPFATPWTFGLLASALTWLDAQLGLPGSIPPHDLMTVLMANLMGSVVVVWSIARLHLGLAILGRYDAAARFLFAAWQSVALMSGMSWVALPLLLVELGFGISQSLPVRPVGALSRFGERSVAARSMVVSDGQHH
jgi:hypothetical protein